MIYSRLNATCVLPITGLILTLYIIIYVYPNNLVVLTIIKNLSQFPCCIGNVEIIESAQNYNFLGQSSLVNPSTRLQRSKVSIQRGNLTYLATRHLNNLSTFQFEITTKSMQASIVSVILIHCTKDIFSFTLPPPQKQFYAPNYRLYALCYKEKNQDPKFLVRARILQFVMFRLPR